MRLFLSYAREDRDLIRPFYNHLLSAGFTVWWDEPLPVGEDFNDVMSEQVDDCDCLLVFWTTTSVGSPYVRGEATRALGLNKLPPIDLDQRPELPPPHLQTVQGVEPSLIHLEGGVPSAETAGVLQEALETVAGRAPAAC